MKTLKYMEGLNSEDTLRKVTSKLPCTIGIRWCRLANKMLRYEERLASFHDVVDFVKDETALATDPFSHLTPLRKQVTAIAMSGTQCGETTGKEETRAQLASLQMPHLKARNPHLDFLGVHSATVTITI